MTVIQTTVHNMYQAVTAIQRENCDKENASDTAQTNGVVYFPNAAKVTRYEPYNIVELGMACIHLRFCEFSTPNELREK